MDKGRKSQKTTFARNLILRRRELGFESAEDFAEHAKMPYPTIRDIESGISGGSPRSREKIAKALNTTVDELNIPHTVVTRLSQFLSLPEMPVHDEQELLGLFRLATADQKSLFLDTLRKTVQHNKVSRSSKNQKDPA